LIFNEHSDLKVWIHGKKVTKVGTGSVWSRGKVESGRRAKKESVLLEGRSVVGKEVMKGSWNRSGDFRDIVWGVGEEFKNLGPVEGGGKRGGDEEKGQGSQEKGVLVVA